MKKLTSILLAVVLLLSLGAFSAFAETQDNLNDAEQEVKIKYATDTPAAYSVDIVWGNMEFDYNAQEEWDKTSHHWNPGTGAHWQLKENGSNTISIQNNSSTALRAVFSFSAVADAGTVSGTFANDSMTLPVPALNTPAQAQSTTFTPEGVLSSDFAAAYKTMGTITITLNS